MKLYIQLLHKIQKKLKQPYNTINLELSYNLNHSAYYYIDSYLKYYLTEINLYKFPKFEYLKYRLENMLGEYNLQRYIVKLYNITNLDYNSASSIKIAKILPLTYICRYPSSIKYFKFLYKRGYNSLTDFNHKITYINNFKLIKYMVLKKIRIDHYFTNLVQENNFEIIKYLLKKGFDVNYSRGYLLRHACEKGYIEIVKLLLKCNCNIYILNCDAFIQASYKGHLNILELLIKHDSSNSIIHALNDEALRYACKRKNLNVVKFLVNKNNKHEFDLERFIRIASRGYKQNPDTADYLKSLR